MTWPGKHGTAACAVSELKHPCPAVTAAALLLLYRCPNPSACQGNRAGLQACGKDAACQDSSNYTNLQCSKGYQGNACGACAAGYGSSKPFTCKACLGFGTVVALLSMSAVTMLGFILLVCHFTHAASDGCSSSLTSIQTAQGTQLQAELLRCLVLYGQRMLLVAAMNIRWPVTMLYPIQALAWFWATASPQTLSLECVLPVSSSVPMAVQQIVFYLSMPVALLVVLLVVEAVWVKFISKGCARSWLTHHWASILSVVLFFYLPGILRVVFGLFTCLPLDKPVSLPDVANAVGSFWVSELATTCFSGYHRGLSLGLGLPLIFLLCICMPGFIVYKTLANRSRLGDTHFRQQYGFLTHLYVPSRCWWEAAVVLETVLLTAISTLGVTIAASYQGLLMVAALMFASHLLIACKPHSSQQATRAALQGMFCLSLTSLVGLSFLPYGSSGPSSTYGLVIGAVVLAVNVVYVLSVLWELLKAFEWRQVANTLRVTSQNVIKRVDSALHPDIYVEQQKSNAKRSSGPSLEVLHFGHPACSASAVHHDDKDAAAVSGSNGLVSGGSGPTEPAVQHWWSSLGVLHVGAASRSPAGAPLTASHEKGMAAEP